jgi:hypothetical protein
MPLSFQGDGISSGSPRCTASVHMVLKKKYFHYEEYLNLHLLTFFCPCFLSKSGKIRQTFFLNLVQKLRRPDMRR